MARKSRAKFADSETTGKHRPTCHCHICRDKRDTDKQREKIREVLNKEK